MAEQVPGQMVADKEALEWVGFNVSESLAGTKGPLISRAGGLEDPHLQCPGSQA